MTQQRLGTWRFDLAFGVLAAVLLATAVYTFGLIQRGHPQALQRSTAQQQVTRPVPAKPGSIFGRTRTRYVLLACSRRVPGCFVDPFVLPDHQFDDAAIGLGRILGVSPVGLQDLLIRRRNARYVVLSKEITDDQLRRVRDLKKERKLRAIGVDYRWGREYPARSLAAAVVGFRHKDGAAGGGLELSQDARLRPTDGRQVLLGDVRRRAVWPVPERSIEARDGHNVFLTLDVVIQGFLDEAVAEAVETFDAKWGTGIVVEPMTGRILAMSSAPTFDPNRFNKSAPATRTNRCISVPFEPGSAAKPLFAAAAVDMGLMSYETRIFCENGRYRARRGGTITDHGRNYGWLTLREVVERSSNIGMAKVGEAIGNDRLWQWVKRFGLGDKSGIELPGESAGIIRPRAKWDGYSLRRVPFGQEMATTALQMAMAFAAMSNGGQLLRPRLIEQVRNAENEVVYEGRREVVRRVLSPQAAAATLSVLQGVVDRGTGRGCRLDSWTTFGKTGTAQIPGPGGYTDGAYVGTFIGGGPVGSPRALCLISVYWPDESKGYYGAKVAAPYVRRVLDRTLAYLRVPADKGGAEWAAR